MKDFIKNLQDKPYEVRMRILVLAIVIAAVGVISVWTLSFKKELANLNKQTLLSGSSASQISTPHYMSIENSEIKDGNLVIYFKAANDTPQILNFSGSSDITLSMDGNNLHPTALTDRQNQPFVSKILSNSQNFGIMKFNLNETRKAKLTFDKLSFESDPTATFQEELSVDFNKLSKPVNIRN